MRIFLRLACLWALVGFAALAQAGSIQTSKATLNQTEDGNTTLSAEFRIDLGPHLEDALAHGVTLFFNLEFEMTRPRWWWANEPVLTRSLNYRLAYTALTRQYRVTVGNLHHNFATLDEALRVLARVTDWPVADKGVIKVGESYAAGLRLSLDRNQLPKPFQIDAIANRDWQVEAKVHRWNYTPVVSAGNGEARP